VRPGCERVSRSVRACRRALSRPGPGLGADRTFLRIRASLPVPQGCATRLTPGLGSAATAPAEGSPIEVLMGIG